MIVCSRPECQTTAGCKCATNATEIARLTAENATLRARLETVEAETRERCAERAEFFSLAEHIAFDMREGIFPEQSDRQTAIADAIRNLEPRHD